nr:immunoglobulin light chain junction region [Macaca mulatta]MOX78641.1 immunoglobulin light chain junction region [Macaca mulatta]MOX78988.1 immunoglobulin light chain junction region [Macaca mulatta]MOX79399.1 immunoglobulin light chain junction region [Macaca mulatta]MOX79910.1 immunoglobulin light chain junction region [Macaca mulatta]
DYYCQSSDSSLRVFF